MAGLEGAKGKKGNGGKQLIHGRCRKQRKPLAARGGAFGPTLVENAFSSQRLARPDSSGRKNHGTGESTLVLALQARRPNPNTRATWNMAHLPHNTHPIPNGPHGMTKKSTTHVFEQTNPISMKTFGVAALFTGLWIASDRYGIVVCFK